MTLPDFSGQTVGHYRLIYPLSWGTTSTVYNAVDTEHPGAYAIKCISKFELTPKQLVHRVSEVFHHQLVTGCSPHVLPLLEIIDEDLYLFIVCKLCEGDLFQAIWDYRAYQRKDTHIKNTFLCILDGVYACHLMGVFHRDLKPENILFQEDGSIRIADFGLATRKRICRGSHCGTTFYIGPEQWTNGSESVYYPSLADIWALGIILINLVAGNRPWQKAHPTDVKFQKFLEDEDYLYNTYPISRELNTILRWILRPNPLERPQILQIWRAILNVGTFYRAPCTPDDAPTEDPKESHTIKNVQSSDCKDQTDVVDVNRHLTKSPGRGSVHQLSV